MSMNVNLKSTVGGIFESIQIIRPDGSIRHELGPFPNLITDDGLDMIGELSDWLTHLKLGTGTTPPAFTDTELENQVMQVTGGGTSNGAYTSAPYGAYRAINWSSSPFPSSMILGEIGVGTADRLFSRTLIKDSEDEPTTIEILEGEMVRVEYRFNYFAPEEDATGTSEFDFDGVPTEVAWVSRASVVTNTGSNTGWQMRSGSYVAFASGQGVARVYAGDIGPVTGSPSGNSLVVGSGSTVANKGYVPGSFAREATVGLGPTVGNLSTSIRSVRFMFGVGVYQMQFDPPIPKDDTKTLVLELSHSWGRAE